MILSLSRFRYLFCLVLLLGSVGLLPAAAVKIIPLGDSFAKAAAVLDVLEGNKTFLNLSPHCEPQLGKRGLYGVAGTDVMAMLWVLNFSDGQHSLLDIAERANLPFGLIERSAQALVANGLLKEV